MNHVFIDSLYKDIERAHRDIIRQQGKCLICKSNSHYPADFPFLVVDSEDNFVAKFNALEQAENFVQRCL